jgi:bifunctional non-homologous end joining protein LigD
VARAFTRIAAIPAELPVKAAYLDGEIAVLTAEGVSDFGALQEALGCHGGSREMAFIAFDLLYLDGRDMRPLPLIECKAMLEKLLAKLPAKRLVQSSGHVTGQGLEFLALECKRHLEGSSLSALPRPAFRPAFSAQARRILLSRPGK